MRHHRLGLVRARVREDEQPAAARCHRGEHRGLHESLEQHCLTAGRAVGQVEDEGAWLAKGDEVSGEGDVPRGSTLGPRQPTGFALEPSGPAAVRARARSPLPRAAGGWAVLPRRGGRALDQAQGQRDCRPCTSVRERSTWGGRPPGHRPVAGMPCTTRATLVLLGLQACTDKGCRRVVDGARVGSPSLHE